MPQCIQGDIFRTTTDHRCDLAIIFGHIGLNEMGIYWQRFTEQLPMLAGIRDPFTELPRQAHQYAPGQWLWFIPEAENHGMTEAQLSEAFLTALTWAQSHGLKKVITNGITNIDHGYDTLANRQSDDQRVRFIMGLASDHERTSGFDIILISLNDAFVRNIP